jgi:hypothetical protein
MYHSWVAMSPLFLFKAFEAQNFGGPYLVHFLTFLGVLKGYMCVLSCSMHCPHKQKTNIKNMIGL